MIVLLLFFFIRQGIVLSVSLSTTSGIGDETNKYSLSVSPVAENLCAQLDTKRLIMSALPVIGKHSLTHTLTPMHCLPSPSALLATTMDYIIDTEGDMLLIVEECSGNLHLDLVQKGDRLWPTKGCLRKH